MPYKRPWLNPGTSRCGHCNAGAPRSIPGPTEVLAVGANSSAVSRFFLGSHAAKIVRSAPVPVTLVPRRRVVGQS